MSSTFSSPGERLYEKGKQIEEKRQLRLQQIRNERQQEELNECLFAPSITKYAQSKKRSQSYDIYESQKQWVS